MRVLILGGTAEARKLAERLVDDREIDPILSLAGRTKNPVTPAIPLHVGGFGGVAGLVSYLRRESIDLVIDATHPFAERMSANAEAACRETSVPLAVFTRPPWMPRAGDRWTEVPDAKAAALAIGETPCRVFLTVGRLQLPAFESAPQHDYLIRSIDPPEPAPNLPRYRLLLARGPFSLDDEVRLIEAERIEFLVTKNSGGEATRAKLDAARLRDIPVILMRRPPSADVLTFHEIEAVLAFMRDPSHRRAP
jgi:precorrin-6A/cobalt-precorrin-6A reductase